MGFFSKVVLATAAIASMAAANTITFVNQDSTARTIVFTPSAGLPEIPSLKLAGSATEVQQIPTGWIGNWYSVSDGQPNVPGMLGEVAFDAWNGIHFFDVSAIVNPNDHNGVKEIFPKNQNTPMSGCQETWPCPNAYNLPDDIATLSTTDPDLVCLVGNLSKRKRSEPEPARFPRHFIDGRVRA
ncbi:hypothetical protein F5884DRAFT_464413 [Xylogone sp. PMI_703]|nr:hypothetical protein F5884DRAFT_464413 [Xylogone sp. PMI_703]